MVNCYLDVAVDCRGAGILMVTVQVSFQDMLKVCRIKDIRKRVCVLGKSQSILP